MAVLVASALISACSGPKPAVEKTLTVGTNIGYPPFEQLASNEITPTGVDVDIIDAVGSVLHEHVKLVNAGFDSLIPSLAAGRYDAVISALGDTRAREAQVTFVDYFLSGGEIVVPSGNPHHVSSLASLCGLDVGTGAGTTEYADASQQSQKCTKDGKSAIQLTTYSNGVAAVLAVESGHIQAALLDSGPAGVAAKTSKGKLQTAGTPFDVGPYGIAVGKSDTKLANSLKRALTTMIANGTYHKILAKWGVVAGATSHVTINAG
ncbi:MAG TPA: ABC transporter substrate-binding protein [Candidatus Dormibacteraeota bacterium]|nr:ABC transporter substrate-binding protein [Candidatus Dormibacteraeota bacterium]